MALQRDFQEPFEIPAKILVQHDLPEPDLNDLVERYAQHELNQSQRSADRTLQSMQDLATLISLPSPPHRIEGYDISHIQGSDAIGSQVVFIDGLPAKQHYRHYKIRNPDIRSGRSDGFASLQEVVARRFRKYAEDSTLPRSGSDWPDLLMIDGGKGQLSSVVEVLKEMDLYEDLRVIGLAKQQEEFFLPGQSQSVVSEPEQPGILLLPRLRDEAHRFGITFHRDRRSEPTQQSRRRDLRLRVQPTIIVDGNLQVPRPDPYGLRRRTANRPRHRIPPCSADP